MRSTLMLVLLLAFSTPVQAMEADHVILISVDGLRADLLELLVENDPGGNYGNFQRLIDEGVSTFNARTDYAYTNTLPNHTCMISGRPVLQPAGQATTLHHGYTSNVTPGPNDTLHNQGNPAVPYIASLFDVAHDHGLTTALYASKSKFIIYDQSYDATNGAPDVTGANDGPDKIDTYQYLATGNPSNASTLHASFMADLASGPADLTFVHYRDPDSAGHASGWGSAVWNNAVSSADGYIGELLDFIDANPILMGQTIVIVTTDHGGTGSGHTNPSDSRNYTIPFFAWGSGVPAGEDLYNLNLRSRLDPGPGRPDYNAAVAPIRNGDSGNLALGLLGLPAIPGSSINPGQDLVVTDPATAVSGVTEGSVFGLRAYPNPFAGQTELSFELEREAVVRLSIVDLSGRLVRVLENGEKSRGRHTIHWNGRDVLGNRVARGVYLFRAESGGMQQTKKLVHVR